MDDFLTKKEFLNVSMTGVLVGYALTGSRYAQPMIMKTAKIRPEQPVHSASVIDAVGFLYDNGNPKLKPWLTKVLRIFLAKEAYQLRAIAMAADWGEASLAGRIVELYGKAEASDEMKRSVATYCDRIESQLCEPVQALESAVPEVEEESAPEEEPVFTEPTAQ